MLRGVAEGGCDVSWAVGVECLGVKTADLRGAAFECKGMADMGFFGWVLSPRRRLSGTFSISGHRVTPINEASQRQIDEFGQPRARRDRTNKLRFARQLYAVICQDVFGEVNVKIDNRRRERHLLTLYFKSWHVDAAPCKRTGHIRGTLFHYKGFPIKVKQISNLDASRSDGSRSAFRLT